MIQLATKHLLTIRDLTAQEALGLIQRARQLKAGWRSGYRPTPLAGKSVAMIFEKPSTRTRVSFEVGVFQLGGKALFIASRDSQISRAEPLRDTARVLSRYVDGIVVRTFGHEVVEDLARFGDIPVINALTDRYHPCQVLGDLQTVAEYKGEVRDQVYAWIGDGNNMAHSWIEAAAVLGLRLRLACPEGYDPDPEIVAQARARGADILLTREPDEAASGATVINTDVWASMGQEDEAKGRAEAFAGFTVDGRLMSLAAREAIVLHCLPAHRGEEISDEVMEGPQSAIWDEAENRLHMQKAIMEALLGPRP